MLKSIEQNSENNRPTPIKNIVLISLVFAVIVSFTIGKWIDNASVLSVLKNIGSNFLFSFFLWLGNERLVHFLNRYISWFERPVLRFFVSFFSTIILTISIVVIIQGCLIWVFFDVSLANYLKSLRPNHFVIMITITAVISLFFHGRAFLTGWKETAVEAEKLQRAHISAQYETLKNQVNPHFLFNSLNVLSTLVYKDQDLAAKFIKQLSKIYRYVLDTREKEVVSLEEEITALESYIFLMKIRFGENLQVDLDLPIAYEDRIVPLTLQMLLENAIKHNETSKSFPLKIEIGKLDESTIFMKNNLQEKSQIREKSGVGLENIRARYGYISDKKMEVMKTENYFEVRVPIVKFT